MSDAKPWIQCGRCEQITNGIGEAALLPKHAPRCHAPRWRSMESAPRDGTRVLVVFHGFSGSYIAWYALHTWTTSHGYTSNPFAWMPLPDPPTGEVEP